MAVNFKEFLIEGRRVRRVVLTPEGNELAIYEPSGDDLQKIYDFLVELETNTLTEAEVTAKVYPLVTDVSFEGLSKELIQDIINSDAKELEEINEEISLILSEAALFRAKRAQVEAVQAEIQSEYMKLGAKTAIAFESLTQALKEIQEEVKEANIDGIGDKDVQEEIIDVDDKGNSRK